MSYGESVAACARLGLDPELTAAVALQRRDGHVTLAADDLAKDWTAVPPSDGWSRYLGDDPATAPPNPAAPGARPHRPDGARSMAQPADGRAQPVNDMTRPTPTDQEAHYDLAHT